jgi:hypothetical protein
MNTAPAAAAPTAAPTIAASTHAAAATKAVSGGTGGRADGSAQAQTPSLSLGAYVSVLYPNSSSYVTATVAEEPGATGAGVEGGKVKVNLLGYGQTVEVRVCCWRVLGERWCVCVCVCLCL